MRALKAESTAREQQARAHDRETLAIDAVRRYGDVVRTTPELKNNAALAELRATLLKEPQAFFKSLRDRLQADRETSPDSLARLAAASFELGHLTDEIGDKEDALRAYEESRAIRERLAREEPAVIGFQSDLATALNNIGILQARMARPAEATASFERRSRSGRGSRETTRPSPSFRGTSPPPTRTSVTCSVRPAGSRTRWRHSSERGTLEERLVRENPSATELECNLALNDQLIGDLQRETGRRAEAMALYEQARVILERLAPENPTVARLQGALAGIQMCIGDLQSETGRPAEAMASYERGLPILERLASEHTSAAQRQINFAEGLIKVGELKGEMSRPEEAMALHVRAHAILLRTVSENPSFAEFQSRLASSHHYIAALQSEAGRRAEALESYEKARVIQQRLASENPSLTGSGLDLAGTLEGIGYVKLGAGQVPEALQSFEQARPIRERLAREPVRRPLPARPGQKSQRYRHHAAQDRPPGRGARVARAGPRSGIASARASGIARLRQRPGRYAA